jgi:integrase
MASLPENVRKRGKNYYFRWRDQSGKQRETPLGPDLSVAKRTAKKLAGQLVNIKAGTADPREQSWADAERKPLTEHVRDWHAYLLAKGTCQAHANQARDRVFRLIESARIFRISGLNLDSIQTALADLRNIKGRGGNLTLSDRSRYHHARMIKAFSRWLWKVVRAKEDLLVHLKPPEVVTVRTRRALEAHEAATLIETTRTQPRRASLSGSDRSTLFAVALGTGYRAKELRSLTPESFSLDADPPLIHCTSCYTKNRKAANQPIRPELASMLRLWLAGKPPGKPVFPFEPNDIARALRKDLCAAGVDSWTEYDFHSLRHSFISMLTASGASVKVCQELARHSDPKLTLGVHSHLRVHDLAQGLEGLSHILPTTGVSKGLTGTDGTMTISSPGRSQSDPKSQVGKSGKL